jgi:AraC-like DNA-binding protein
LAEPHTPLYIDLHIDNSLTPDVIRKCHVADKAIQQRYGVRYLQILLNQPQGYLFCLVEGPDKESCERVHQEAHGNIACNILEITESDFGALLAKKQKDVMDFTLNADGTLDTGNRTILAIDLVGPNAEYREAKQLIAETFDQHAGRSGARFENRLLAVFDSCDGALQAAITIAKRVRETKLSIEVRMGVDLGPPLRESGNFFEDVCKSADRFCFISRAGHITLPAKVMELCAHHNTSHSNLLNVVPSNDATLLNRLMSCIEKVWNESEVTIGALALDVGMSKSQLTRKVKMLSGLSPNDFVREFRLRKAMRLLQEGSMNIGEITMAIGFSNPSYFTKCFRKRFGKAPSDYYPAD